MMIGFDGCCCKKCGCFDDPPPDLIVTMPFPIVVPPNWGCNCQAMYDLHEQPLALTYFSSYDFQGSSVCLWRHVLSSHPPCRSPLTAYAQLVDAYITHSEGKVTDIKIELAFDVWGSLQQWTHFDTPHDCVFDVIAMDNENNIEGWSACNFDPTGDKWWTISTP
jgi:hypothetical protein